MDKSICKFIPSYVDYHIIHAVNYILERKQQPFRSLKSEPTYKIYYVLSGTGTLHNTGRKNPLKSGDVFFTFPSTPFAIESIENFEYMYITFFGTRANMLMEKLKITIANCIFSDCAEIYDNWINGINTITDVLELSAESVLLSTFAYLGNRFSKFNTPKAPKDKTAHMIKKYIDDNFTNGTLSIEDIGNELSYSPKYISAAFKKGFNIGICEYINTIRIQHAIALMEQGFTAISDISVQCGYNDPQYFSKVFKKNTGVSPSLYISKKGDV